MTNQNQVPLSNPTQLQPQKVVALYPYQEIGARFLSQRKAALLADKQRLGKSAQAIRACDLVQARKILVICRAIARENWKNEFEKFTLFSDRSYQVVFSGEDLADADNLQSYVQKYSDTVVVVSYEGLSHILKRPHFHFDVVIVDESHYLKSVAAKRTKDVFGIDGICHKTRQIWCLTGTPAPNNASELWTTLFTFGATKQSFNQFTDKFCVVKETGYGRQIVGTRTDEPTIRELQEIMRPLVLRREEKDVNIELPKINFDTVIVEPGAVELSEHEMFVPYVLPYDRTADLQKKLQQEMGILNAIVNGKYASDELMATLMAEAKSLSSLRRFTALQKIEPAVEMIREEMASGAYKKCVIFAIHQSIIRQFEFRLQEFGPLCLYGGTKPSRVARYLKAFQDPDSEHRIMVCNIHAAGTSISLSAAHHIFFIEESWTPGDNAQAAMRCGGVNQKNPIFVRTFSLPNSVDQKVQGLLRKKMEEISKIFSKTESTDSIKSIEELL